MTPADVARSRSLVACPGMLEGEETYPAAQFHEGGSVTPGLDAVAAALGDDVDALDLVAFLTCPLPALGGQTAFGWLQAGGDVRKVIRLAAS